MKPLIGLLSGTYNEADNVHVLYEPELCKRFSIKKEIPIGIGSL